MSTKKQAVTPVVDLSEIAKGVLVELSGWTDDAPFVARKSKASATFKELIDVQRLVVSEALVEPSEAVLKDLGLDLTEQQVEEIYTYALRGPKVLEQFRALTQNRHADQHGDAESDTSERTAGDS